MSAVPPPWETVWLVHSELHVLVGHAEEAASGGSGVTMQFSNSTFRFRSRQTESRGSRTHPEPVFFALLVTVAKRLAVQLNTNQPGKGMKF